ncbi:hypothetical protein ADUPG1_003960, partial [Aduncisulcus paluster]
SDIGDDNRDYVCEIPELAERIREIIEEYERNINRDKPARVEEFKIKLLSTDKVWSKTRRHPIQFKEHLEIKLDELLEKGIIEPSESPYAAPLVLLPKPAGGIRMCVDYTRLNKIIEDDRYPIPRQEDLFEAIEGQRIFAAIDLENGYYHIPIRKEDQQITAFTTARGLFEWKRMPFG